MMAPVPVAPVGTMARTDAMDRHGKAPVGHGLRGRFAAYPMADATIDLRCVAMMSTVSSWALPRFWTTASPVAMST